MDKPTLDAAALDTLREALNLPTAAKFDSLRDSELIVAGLIAQARAALTLRDKLSACERERDEARAQVAEREAEIARLRAEMGIASGFLPKSPASAAGTLIGALMPPAPDSALREFEQQTIERAALAVVAGRSCVARHPFNPAECEECHWFDGAANLVRALGGAK